MAEIALQVPSVRNALRIPEVGIVLVLNQIMSSPPPASETQYIRAGFVVLYCSVFDLVRQMQADQSPAEAQRTLDRYLKPDLLCIDDFGMKHFPPTGSPEIRDRGLIAPSKSSVARSLGWAALPPFPQSVMRRCLM